MFPTDRSSLTTELYNPKTFFTHAALLGQSFLHCRKFPTAASRRSLGRVSVPMWPFTLSGRLCIIALVGRYLTNKLMHRKPIHQCFPSLTAVGCPSAAYPVLVPVSRDYPGLRGQVAYVLLTRSPLSSPVNWFPSFDLHVLGTPPAFILSQDQTLHLFLARYDLSHSLFHK